MRIYRGWLSRSRSWYPAAAPCRSTRPRTPTTPPSPRSRKLLHYRSKSASRGAGSRPASQNRLSKPSHDSTCGVQVTSITCALPPPPAPATSLPPPFARLTWTRMRWADRVDMARDNDGAGHAGRCLRGAADGAAWQASRRRTSEHVLEVLLLLAHAHAAAHAALPRRVEQPAAPRLLAARRVGRHRRRVGRATAAPRHDCSAHPAHPALPAPTREP